MLQHHFVNLHKISTMSTLRNICKIHQAVPAHMPGLKTWRAIPVSTLNHLDPFIFLNHHGPEDFKPDNEGLPFGPHPHRGFETLTFVISGDVVHKDSTGGSDKIVDGGVQWMTAGSGLVHSEVSSEDFKEKGGREEILQLWMNLPSHLKMTKPGYQSFDYDEITHFSPSEGVQVNLISGEWNGEKGPKDSLTGLLLSSIEMQSGSQWTHQPAEDDVIFFYVVKGLLKVNGQEVQMRKLGEGES